MITLATAQDYPAIIEVWEDAVRATHHFLPEDYLQHIKQLLPSILPHVEQLFITRDDDGQITGFLGVVDQKIEMLFIHSCQQGQGIGRTLTKFAIEELKAYKVDVNEQNEQAVGFYQHIGFAITQRKETDGLGKPFPLLEMTLRC